MCLVLITPSTAGREAHQYLGFLGRIETFFNFTLPLFEGFFTPGDCPILGNFG
jgi:hypothetical protein